MLPPEAAPCLDDPSAATPLETVVAPGHATLTSDPTLLRAHDLVRRGRIREALAQLDDAAQSATAAADRERAVLVALSMECRLARGDVGDALALSTDLTPLLDLPGVTGAVAHFARGELASALGEPELAAGHLMRVGELLAAEGPEALLLPWRAVAALATIRLGQRRGAVALGREQLRLAQGAPYESAQALRALAAADATGDRIATLRRAREVLADTEARRLAAQIDTDLASLLMLQSSAAASAEALRLLRSAEVYAGAQDLWPLRTRVRRFLVLMGETPSRVREEALALLTKAERRVALLAATGLTNRQIAERLTVTVKAVEWHLSHVYRKLELRSRAGLTLLVEPD
ncbi:LuxR C-terminal-related transcriptional regulator [Nocardioides sp.]|uniref:helix-turn-helix transcriptional regulator n=1 Tax=Nocardioides sp. TaxID=35761 RepID=UPI0035632B98